MGRYEELLREAGDAVDQLDGGDPGDLNRVALAVGRLLGYLEALEDTGRARPVDQRRAVSVVRRLELSGAVATGVIPLRGAGLRPGRGRPASREAAAGPP